MTFSSTTFKDSVAYEGGVIFMTNAATASFTGVTMTNGKAINLGGAIYSGGTGAASISFSSCAATVSYFESYINGGFLYIANQYTTLSTSGCCYNNLFALSNGGFIQGSYEGSTFSSSCTQTNVTDNTPSTLVSATSCGYDEYYVSSTSSCIKCEVAIYGCNMC
jgi:hypothetical protein